MSILLYGSGVLYAFREGSEVCSSQRSESLVGRSVGDTKQQTGSELRSREIFPPRA